MARMRRGLVVASSLTLVMLFASACQLPYSQAPSVTNTPIDPNSLFATPLGSATQMSDVEIFMTGTALALMTETPGVAVETQTGDPPLGSTPETITPTLLLPLNPTITPTATLAVSGPVSGPSSTALPPGSRPSTYVLQKGEFPYCIARRFDVNPQELLNLNNLPSGDIYYPNLTLKIPQTGNPFPPPRALRPHPNPTTYTVSASDQTVGGVACVFGDADPAAIAQANNISVGAALTVGQQLSIP